MGKEAQEERFRHDRPPHDVRGQGLSSQYPGGRAVARRGSGRGLVADAPVTLPAGSLMQQTKLAVCLFADHQRITRYAILFYYMAVL